MPSARGVMIVGGSGFVGTQLALKLREGYRVISTHHTRSIRIPGVLNLPLDFREESWTKALIYRFRPDVIIYLSGSQELDWIDHNLPAAEKIISNGAGEIMRLADIFQPRLIYLSTPFVFDGTRGNYLEKDSLSPYNNFGKLKAGAENLVKGRAGTYTLIRSAPLLGCSTPHRPSFIDKLRLALSRGERLELQNYELHNFGAVSSLTEMVDQAIQNGPRKGVFHFGGLTRVTHYELAVKFAKAHDFDEKLLVPRKRPVSKYLADVKLDFSVNFTEAVNHLNVKPLEVEEILKDLSV